MKSGCIRVLLVEAHVMVREALGTLLGESPSIEVVALAVPGDEAAELAGRLSPDVVVTDAGSPEALAGMIRSCPSARVLVLSATEDSSAAVAAFRAGAKGYVTKHSSLQALIEAITCVARGGSVASPQLMRALFDAGSAPPTPGLTPRELQVLRLLASGKSSKEAAVALNVQTETLRTYRKQIMRKIQVNNAAGLTRFAMQAGLLPDSTPHRAPVERADAGGSGTAARQDRRRWLPACPP